ncbi:MAG: prepilin-type N-terminal cleavage/methylation domain-containing protein [Gemmatimonadetes bacterium]|nr:prepilin-type N-terminal cleavage/methylation domain-containing protein [Gemmatimonadota bacterium]
MLKARVREGFTLLELVAVVVIIGLLAAMAIPKYFKSRERAYFTTLRSDLRNLATAEELYYSSQRQYTGTTSDLGEFQPSKGVTFTFSAATTTGYAVVASHDNLVAGSQGCAFKAGDAADPSGYTLTAGIIVCKGE